VASSLSPNHAPTDNLLYSMRQPRVLSYGEFFGAAQTERRTDSFVFTSMRATASPEQLPRHSHENGHFVQVLRGQYVTAASDDICAHATLIFNPPDTTHRDHFVGGQGEFLGISVSPEISQLMPAGRPAVLGEPRLLGILRDVRAELRLPDADSEMLLEGLGLELASRTTRLRRWPDPRPPKWLVEVRDLLREEQELTIGEIAQRVRVHRVHLARAFRQYFRSTPGAFKRACRVETACRLLERPKYSLADVAQRAGYCDQSQFTRAFKRSTGLAPGEWRRAHS
jgi:AraC family transcriptional regulator